ncbi:histone-like nucleoid-structuring protein Lsr2 [Pseudonocardia acaciae]|uniref:histone-like nucleoid-structuring protein Lsr2 n=1 Tax=Pseudonocardia acaciae TaxID=551276 RepID=UPI00068865D1|nr:Lsr2 family protein [Pseudonocardia acaciae]
MAKRVTITLIDDRERQHGREVEATSTTRFSLDHRHYEIDLSESNRAELDAIMRKYIQAARPQTGRRRAAARRVLNTPTGQRSPAVTDREQNQAIRAWAARRGVKINPKGRIPGHVLDAYHASATTSTATTSNDTDTNTTNGHSEPQLLPSFSQNLG